MLRLDAKTDPEWVEIALSSVDDVLIDHAHLEKKAASAALRLIFMYPEHPSLHRPLSELAREELEHFELVLTHLERRGVTFGRIKPSPYAGRLRSIERKADPGRLLDTLLSCAVIEARSCERMKVLAEHLEDPPLKKLYRGLLAAEARHHQLYVDLAKGIFDPDEVEARLTEVVAHEAQILGQPPREPRLHS